MFSFPNEKAEEILDYVSFVINQEIKKWNERYKEDEEERRMVDIILQGEEEETLCLLLDERMKDVIGRLAEVNEINTGYKMMKEELERMQDQKLGRESEKCYLLHMT